GLRHKKLRSNGIAPNLFAAMSRQRGCSRVRDRRAAQPQVGQLVRQREHLPGFGVSAVDEYKRCEPVSERKPPEFFWIECSLCIAEDDAAHHHQHADLVGLSDEEPQSLFPCSAIRPGVEIETKRPRHMSRHRFRGRSESCAADEPNLRLARCQRELPIPALPFLAGIEHVEQVGTGSQHGPPLHRPEIWDRERFFGRVLQEQITDGDMDRASEGIQLLEGRRRFASLPGVKLGETMKEVRRRQAGPRARPDNYSGIDRRTVHATASAIFSASRTRISPDMSFGRRRSRVAARALFSRMFARKRCKNGSTTSTYWEAISGEGTKISTSPRMPVFRFGIVAPIALEAIQSRTSGRSR